MDLPGPEFLDRVLFGGVTIGEALAGFVVLIVVMTVINRIQRARMLKK